MGESLGQRPSPASIASMVLDQTSTPRSMASTPLHPRRLSYASAATQLDALSDCTSVATPDLVNTDGASDLALTPTHVGAPSALLHPGELEAMRVSPCKCAEPMALDEVTDVVAGSSSGVRWPSSPVMLCSVFPCRRFGEDLDESPCTSVALGPTQMWGSGGFCDRLAVSPPSQESSGCVEPRDVESDRCAQMGSPPRVRQAASIGSLQGSKGSLSTLFSEPYVAEAFCLMGHVTVCAR